MKNFDYIIIGAGLAGVSAIKGIRKEDKDGSILLIGKENQIPYNRPPLTKDLLLGKKKIEEIRIENDEFYSEQKVEMNLGTEATKLDIDNNLVTDDRGEKYKYGKLLLSTGGSPRKLDIPGGNIDEVIYYRYLTDYKYLSARLNEAKKAVVIGGGFIGSEIAAGLELNDVQVSMVFPEDYLLERVLPREISALVKRDYENRGIDIISGDKPKRIIKDSDGLELKTNQGKLLQADLLVAGIGITPRVELAKKSGLEIYNGIEVNDHLETSEKNIYAAGDNTYFPFTALEKKTRIEHWDNAKSQGKLAGKNMAGAGETYDYIPYFFSDLFDFGFEAVGDVNTELTHFVDWMKKGEKGIGYYLSESGKVKGVLLFGVWGKKEEARSLIKDQTSYTKKDLRGKIG